MLTQAEEDELELLELEEEEAVYEESIRKAAASTPTVEADDPNAPTGLDKWSERARGVNRGVQNAFEFASDIVDIPIQGGKALLSEGLTPQGVQSAFRAMGEQVNPMGEDSEIDRLRQEHIYDSPIVRHLTEEKVDDSIATGLEWGVETAIAPGKKIPNIIEGFMAGAGSMMGGEIAGETGELVGAITGALASPTKTIQKYGAKFMDDIFDTNYSVKPPQAETPDQKVFEFIEENAHGDGKEAIANFEKNRAAGMKGSVADLTENQGIYNIEEAIHPSTVQGGQIKAQKLEGEQQTLQQLNEAFGEGDPNVSIQQAQEYVDAAKADITSSADAQVAAADYAEKVSVSRMDNTALILEREAEAAQELADSRIADVPESPEASMAAVASWQKFDDYLNDEFVKPAWNDFKNVDQTFDGLQWRKDGNDVLKGLNRGDAALVREEHKDIFRMMDRWTKQVVDEAGKPTGARKTRKIEPSEVHSVVKKINDKFRIAQNNNELDDVLINLKSIANKFDDSLRADPSEAGALYDKAMKMSHNRFERVTRGRTGKARAKEEEVFGETIFAARDGGKRAATDLKKALADGNNPEAQALAQQALEKTQDYVRSQAQIEGKVTQKWMDSHRPFLKEFPELQQEMQQVVDSQTGLTKATRALKQGRTKAGTQGKALGRAVDAERKAIDRSAGRLTDTVEKSDVARYARDSEDTISDLISGETTKVKRARIKNLYDTIDDKDGFVKEIGNQVTKKLRRFDDGAETIDNKAMNDWAKMKPTLEGVIPQAQLKKIDDAVGRTIRSSMAKNSYSQNMKAVKSMGSDAAINIAAAMIAANLPGTHALMYGGKIRGFLKRFVKEDVESQELLARVMSDPDEFANLLERLGDKPDMTPDEFNRLKNLFVQQGAGTAGREESE